MFVISSGSPLWRSRQAQLRPLEEDLLQLSIVRSFLLQDEWISQCRCPLPRGVPEGTAWRVQTPRECLQPLRDLLSHHCIPVTLPDIEVGAENVGDRLVGDARPKEGHFPLKERDILMKDCLPELIQERISPCLLRRRWKRPGPGRIGHVRRHRGEVHVPSPCPRRGSTPLGTHVQTWFCCCSERLHGRWRRAFPCP